MTQRHGSTVDIDPVRTQPKFFDRGYSYHRKGFVHFVEIKILAGFLFLAGANRVGNCLGSARW